MALRAYTFLSSLPMYTTPWATVGDDLTASPVVYRHRSKEVAPGDSWSAAFWSNRVKAAAIPAPAAAPMPSRSAVRRLRARVGAGAPGALLHHALLPCLQVTDEIFTRRMMNPGFPWERQKLARDYQHTPRLVLTDIESLQNSARRAFASYSSLVSGEQNSVINRLAIVSTIFLPLTFLTGFFGMNFSYLTDELESGDVFWLLAVGLQAAFLLIALYALHRTRIWRKLRDDDGVDDL